MSDYYTERCYNYNQMRDLPHCKTCTCHREAQPPLNRARTVPRMGPQRRHSPENDGYGDRHPSSGGRRRTTGGLGKHRNSSQRLDEGDSRKDHKFSVLEGWFKRFDLDGNGLLDVYELKHLLNHLGIDMEQEYVNDLIERADRDVDGMLSFSEFLYMWHDVARNDPELHSVIREHGLLPDIPSKRPQKPLRKPPVKDYHQEQKMAAKECSCGRARNPVAGRRGRPVDLEIKPRRHRKRASPTFSDDGIPVMSSNR